MKSSVFLFFVLSLSANLWADQNLQKVALGKLIFNDKNLSEPAGQACASCHQAKTGHADQGNVVSPGANSKLFGNRNAPSISYIKFNPNLFWNKEEELWMGGFFLDGREKTLQDQAGGPFLNPVEMANSSKYEVVNKVKISSYSKMLELVYGNDIWADGDRAFLAITDAIVEYEKGPEFALFNSKYDAYLNGKAELTELEKKGLDIFEAEDKGNCAACHPSQIGEKGEMPLFTDYSYDNLGAPTNKQLPFLAMAKKFNSDGKAYKDTGLMQNPHIQNGTDEVGKFKVSTLRNIAVTAPYMHNGVFETLEEAVNFYNTRDIDDKWAEPEIKENMNADELGDLKLSEDEEKAIVAFLKTLTDGYQL